MTLPRATARLQLHAGFTLVDACVQVPYYARLGISHFYLSPVSQAVPGSSHGYDVVNHEIISPELGGEAAFVELAHRLREHDMGIILDIVPNHMATDPHNRWWWDVLRSGRSSAYAEWFDIDWDSSDSGLRGKVLAPFLAQSYGASLANGKITLVFDVPSQSFQIQAYDVRYPLSPGSLGMATTSVERTLAHYNSEHVENRLRLHQLLERQHYVLSWWRCAADRINWRRFFEVNGLIGLRVEQRAVFDAVHALPLRLFAQGLIDGLRVDHVDGLAQPLAYCQRLKTELVACGAQRPGMLRNDEPWLVVEKILGGAEVLDQRWAVHGTTGYDFMDQVSAVLHDGTGEPALTAYWNKLSGNAASLCNILEDARRQMLQRHFVAERNALLRALSLLARSDMATRDWTEAAIGRVLDTLLVMFPIYRTYVEGPARGSNDAALFALVIEKIRLRLKGESDGGELALLDLLDYWLGAARDMLLPPPCVAFQRLRKNSIRHFQQLTPPLAAKSLEDTVFYRYGRLLSRNEVGSDPGVLALSADCFHNHNRRRALSTPRSMLATATHDQKRGEDVRARLAVLSEVPDRWVRTSQRWLLWPARGLTVTAGRQAAERYMLFQTLVGTWPLDIDLDDTRDVANYTERIVQWQVKALREAKMNSSWSEPGLCYERASIAYIRWLLQGGGCGLRSEIDEFVQTIAPAGAVNGFAQMVLRITAPGVPDMYQGTEFWDFTLVDPDNRRPVDFIARHTALGTQATMHSLIMAWRNGHIKQELLRRSLQALQEMPEVFADGQYLRVAVAGSECKHVVAFLRVCGNRAALIVVPRLCSKAIGIGNMNGLPLICPEFWQDTSIVVPGCSRWSKWRDTLGGAAIHATLGGRVRLKDVLARLPVALLVSDSTT